MVFNIIKTNHPTTQTIKEILIVEYNKAKVVQIGPKIKNLNKLNLN